MERPEGFSWVTPGLLAATARPNDVHAALEYFREAGITAIVSLTERPFASAAYLEEFGFAYHHIPVEDFSAPDMEQIEQFVEIVKKAKQEGGKVVVHCMAGRGRTGTMLACYFVSTGVGPDEALARVRALRPGSVETELQQDAVREYARRVRRNE